MTDVNFIRTRPDIAMKACGFIVRPRDDQYYQSGRCSVTCRPLFPTRIAILDVLLTDKGGDWYCGYEENEALSVLVPFGQPDGTLILTYPMNGCALDVRCEPGGNRIYHDFNGVSMPLSPEGNQTLRVTADHYMDRFDRHSWRIERVAYRAGLKKGCYGYSFEHTLICVKQGSSWGVYNTAVSKGSGRQNNTRLSLVASSFVCFTLHYVYLCRNSS